MEIFMTSSHTGEKKYHKEYVRLLAELRRHNVKAFATFESPYAAILAKARTTARTPKERKYANDIAIRKAISQADAVVIEASYPSFRLGFEAFYALISQKPVLVLSKTQDYSNLIDQPHFFGAKYTDFTLPDEVDKFLRHVKNYRLRSRFNLFISYQHRQKLEARAKQLGVSMSDYVRKLVEEDVGI